MSDSRLFKILYYLLDKGRATAPELAAEFKVSTRTIYRDVDALNEVGIPICAESGRRGGIYIKDGFLPDKENMSDKDKSELFSSLQNMATKGLTLEGAMLTQMTSLFKNGGESAKSSTGSKSNDKAEDSDDTIISEGFSRPKTAKNAESVSANSGNNASSTDIPDWLDINFSRWGNQEFNNAKFETLKTAITERLFVEISYLDSVGKTNKLKIQPLKLSYKSKDWYLKGYCPKNKEFHDYNCSRITALDVTKENFTPMQLPKEEDARLSYRKVELSFSKKAAPFVYAEFEESQIKARPDDTLLVKANIPIDDWLIGYLLSNGAQVEVLEPTYLRKILARRAQATFEKNN